MPTKYRLKQTFSNGKTYTIEFFIPNVAGQYYLKFILSDGAHPMVQKVGPITVNATARGYRLKFARSNNMERLMEPLYATLTTPIAGPRWITIVNGAINAWSDSSWFTLTVPSSITNVTKVRVTLSAKMFYVTQYSYGGIWENLSSNFTEERTLSTSSDTTINVSGTYKDSRGADVSCSATITVAADRKTITLSLPANPEYMDRGYVILSGYQVEQVEVYGEQP